MQSCANEPSTPLPSDYTISVNEVVASGLERPVGITHAGDGSGRLFVLEQRGKIKIVQNGAVLKTPFLDIQLLVSNGSEQGLLGLAFHPDFKTNGYFYIDYTDVQGTTNIVRYSVSADPNQADPSSATLIMSIPQPYANHNGGQLAFGPDGYLYIAMGDGGSANDPHNNGQSLKTPLGKILRVNVNEQLPYSIPADNPFTQVANADPRIWVFGLRNPWRFSFDRMNGDIYIGDVGQDQWEEIDFLKSGTPGGINFGWSCLEGNHPNRVQAPCDEPNVTAHFTSPITEYSHQEGESVTGGYVYRGKQFSIINGVYFYADFSSGKIWSIRLLDRKNFTWSEPRLEAQAGFNISSFGEDENGEVVLTDYAGGTIRHLTVEVKAN